MGIKERLSFLYILILIIVENLFIGALKKVLCVQLVFLECTLIKDTPKKLSEVPQ